MSFLGGAAASLPVDSDSSTKPIEHSESWVQATRLHAVQVSPTLTDMLEILDESASQTMQHLRKAGILQHLTLKHLSPQTICSIIQQETFHLKFEASKAQAAASMIRTSNATPVEIDQHAIRFRQEKLVQLTLLFVLACSHPLTSSQ